VRREHFDGKVPFSTLRTVLNSLAYVETDHLYSDFVQQHCKGMQGDQLGLWELVRLIFQFRTERGAFAAEKTFFTDAQLANIRKRFRKYEKKRNHGVPLDSLPLLLEDLHPPCRRKEHMIKSLLPEAGLCATDSQRWQVWKVCNCDDGLVQLKDCVQLIRQAYDQVDRSRLEKARLAMKKVKFTDQEVREFRRIFHTFDRDETGDVAVTTFSDWMSEIILVEMTQLQFEVSLTYTLRNVVEAGTRHLDFAEFLHAMRVLLDEDWNKINEYITSSVNPPGRNKQSSKYVTAP